ncbi:protein transport protein HofC [Musicola paradisiaca]|uniref:Type II secretion system protein F n=1 Tax=Musicola paradisiaca (strain Ech703) TaxID=579405 RepID=C6C9M4_MUSP7|nr:protein transport protein HofC [Musicola paradisiaca]ACS84475.1 type II secretion system protein [Musicola paradisiaca Ech703]
MALQKLYRWQALHSNGEFCTGEHIGYNRRQIYQHLLEQGYQPLKLTTSAYITPRYWKGTHLAVILRQIASLLQAGLPLPDALALIGEHHEKAGWRCLLSDIRHQILQGRAFSDAIGDYPDIFPAICGSLLAVGELTGKLDECCARLAVYQETQQQLASNVMKAIRYPVFVIVAGMLVGLLMTALVLPEFAGLYATFNAPLPWFTRLMLSFSDNLRQYGLPALLLLLCLTLMLSVLRKRSIAWRTLEHRLALKLPLISALIRGHCLSQLFHSLSMTQYAGIPLPAGLSAASAINHPLYRHALRQAKIGVEQGLSFAQAIGDPWLFPAPCPQLIRVGEETGALDQLFNQLARWYEKHTQELTDTLTQAIEPLLIAIVGGIVGMLVIAMYLPIFQLGNVLAGA